MAEQQTQPELLRKCIRCGEVKPIDCYAPSKSSRGGRRVVCRECAKLDVKYVPPTDESRARHRAYAKAWRSRHPDRAKAASRRLSKEKKRAHVAVGKARRRGKLVPQPCEVCGSTENLHAHHFDYSQRFNVLWLCPLHHNHIHLAERMARRIRRKLQG